MFRSVDDEIAEIYNKRFRKLGPTPEASMWFSKKRQFERFDVIFNQVQLLCQINSISISDVGCGYGAFLEYLLAKKLNEKWRYYGYDVCPEVIRFCKKKYFERASFYTKSVPVHKTDFVIMSGTFNFFPTQDYNASGGIVYAAREEVEQFCKTNFGNVRVINNPMIPKDKTFVVSK